MSSDPLMPYDTIRHLVRCYKLVKQANRPDIDPLDEKSLQAFVKSIKAEQDRKLQLKAYLLALKNDSNPEAAALFQDILEAL